MYPATIKILIVDDMMTMRKLVTKALKEIGFENVTEAANGALGWEAMSSGMFDLVISDWNMPVATGLDLLKRVRADGRYKKTPFLLLTAETEAEQVKTALAAGASGYVVKPFTVAALKEQIEQVSNRVAS